MPYRGSCACGAVRYEIDQLDTPIGHCHCTTCRKTQAASFVSTARVNRDHFRLQVSADRDELYIAKPVIGRTSGQWTVQFSRRITLADGSFAGVATLHFDPFKLTQFYDAIDLDEHSTISVIGLDGALRARRGADAKSFLQDISAPLSDRELLKLAADAVVSGFAVPAT